MGNPVCHMELTTWNVDGAKGFYEKLFDWKIAKVPGPLEYLMIQTGGETEGGMMHLPEPGVPTSWTMYVQVDDVEASCHKLEKLGGKVCKGKTEVPGFGWFAIVCDPQGAWFGLWQNAG